MPIASSTPLLPLNESPRQRPSAATERNERGNRSYPPPSDQEPQGSEKSLEVSEPIPPLSPPTRYGPPSRFLNAVRSAPIPASRPTSPWSRLVRSPCSCIPTTPTRGRLSPSR